MPDFSTLGCVAWHMQGEVADHLVEAQKTTAMHPELQATALLTAAAWCREYRNGVLPADLISQARLLSRLLQKDDRGIRDMLVDLADLTQDAGLTKLLDGAKPELARDGRKIWEHYLDLFRAPILNQAPTAPRNMLARGSTLRRAVPRLSRNDPCHCGSGKKYKNCCIEKDQERLKHSSDVAGFTQEEVAAEPEQHLTAKRLGTTAPHQLVRFDPKKIPADLIGPYLHRLILFHLYDRVVEAFEQLGCSEELEETWHHVLFFVTRAGRRDLAERLLKVQTDPVTPERELWPGTRLLLAQDDPIRYLQLLEELALEALQTEDSRDLRGFAIALLDSKLRALGIFVARSMVPILEQKDATDLFEEILKMRDKLKLSPDDPYSDIFDKRFAEDETGDTKDAEALRHAQQLLEAKAHEFRRLKVLLIESQQEIARHEQQRRAPAPAAPVAPPPAPGDEAALRELRRKVEELKTGLNERHRERNQLRRELQQAYADLETLRQQASPATAHEESEANAREEALLLPEEPVGNQPVRLIEFPRDFAGILRRVPPVVARTTLIALGRIASGEAAAFMGSIRLKDCAGVLRRRLGEYRLLYRLHPDRVEVIDLIPRCDLERRIKIFMG